MSEWSKKQIEELAHRIAECVNFTHWPSRGEAAKNRYRRAAAVALDHAAEILFPDQKNRWIVTSGGVRLGTCKGYLEARLIKDSLCKLKRDQKIEIERIIDKGNTVVVHDSD